MRFSQITSLLEGYKEAQSDFSKLADSNEVKELIGKFKDAVTRNLVTGQERNIDFWRKQGFEQFKQFVQSTEQKMSGRQAKGKTKQVGKSIRVHEDNHWLVVVPLDKDASCFYGKDTAWCTTKSFANHYETYFYDKRITLIYFLNKDSGNKWAIAYHTGVDREEYFDQDDQSITAQEFRQQTKLDPQVYIEKTNARQDQIENVRNTTYHKSKEELAKRLEDKEISSEVESLLFLVKDVDMIFDYMDYAKENTGNSIQRLAANLVRDSVCHITSSLYPTTFFNYKWIPDTLKQRTIDSIVKHISNFDKVKFDKWYRYFGVDEINSTPSFMSPEIRYPYGVDQFNKVKDIIDENFEKLSDSEKIDTYLKHKTITNRLIDLLVDHGSLLQLDNFINYAHNDIEFNESQRLETAVSKAEMQLLKTAATALVSENELPFLNRTIDRIVSHPHYYNTKYNVLVNIAKQSTNRDLIKFVVDHIANKVRYQHNINDIDELLTSLSNNPKANTVPVLKEYLNKVTKNQLRVDKIPTFLLTPRNVFQLLNNLSLGVIIEILKVNPRVISEKTAKQILVANEIDVNDLTPRTSRWLDPLLAAANVTSESRAQVVQRILQTGSSIKSEADTIIEKYPNDPEIISALLQVGVVPNIKWNDTIGMLLLMTTKSADVVKFLLSKNLINQESADEKLKELGVPVKNESVEYIKKLAGLK